MYNHIVIAEQELLEYEKFLGYLNRQVSPATLIFLVLSTTRTLVDALFLLQSEFLSNNIDAHSFIVIMLLVQWTTISVAPLVSVSIISLSLKSDYIHYLMDILRRLL